MLPMLATRAVRACATCACWDCVGRCEGLVGEEVCDCGGLERSDDGGEVVVVVVVVAVADDADPPWLWW
jgi:hypothetical protein